MLNIFKLFESLSDKFFLFLIKKRYHNFNTKSFYSVSNFVKSNVNKNLKNRMQSFLFFYKKTNLYVKLL